MLDVPSNMRIYIKRELRLTGCRKSGFDSISLARALLFPKVLNMLMAVSHLAINAASIQGLRP